MDIQRINELDDYCIDAEADDPECLEIMVLVPELRDMLDAYTLLHVHGADTEDVIAQTLCKTWPKDPNGCAARCLDRLGDIKTCQHAKAVHGERARTILQAIRDMRK